MTYPVMLLIPRSCLLALPHEFRYTPSERDELASRHPIFNIYQPRLRRRCSLFAFDEAYHSRNLENTNNYEAPNLCEVPRSVARTVPLINLQAHSHAAVYMKAVRTKNTAGAWAPQRACFENPCSRAYIGGLHSGTMASRVLLLRRVRAQMLFAVRVFLAGV